MRVLQINSVCGVGSTGRIVMDIHSTLEKEGHESFIAYGRGNYTKQNNIIKISNKLDTYLHVGKTRIFDKHGLGSKRATKNLLKQIDQLNPDIIHLHNIHGYYVNIEILFEYLNKIDKPIVWTLHDCWPFTGHCAYFDYVDCNRWQQGCFSCPQQNSYPASLVLDNSSKNFELKKRIFTMPEKLTIITPSEWLAELVRKSFMQKYPVKIINNGIDLSQFKPAVGSIKARLNIPNKFMILGVASVWDKRKGFDYFIELSKRLTENEIIVLVGLNKDQINILPKNIIGFEKTKSVTELSELYSSADVYVNPTLEDNFPTTNLEAMACGTPIITFNTGGSVESVDETNGFIVEKGDVEKIHDIITQLHRVGKQKYTDYCLKKVSNSYDKRIQYQMYIDHYHSINLQ